MKNMSIDEIIKLPYTIEVVYDQGEGNSGWFARVVEWPGCMTQADNFAELGEMIEDAMRAWAETCLEEGQEIPEPRQVEDYSGKFVTRVPKSLHRELVECAEREGVSLNAFVNVALGKAVGAKTTENPPAKESEPLPIINWQRLSDQARRILIFHGLSFEAQTVDERLFASWIEENIAQINASIKSGILQEGLRYASSLQQALESLSSLSPIITTYCQVLTVLIEQLNLNMRLREGIIDQSLMNSRVNEQAIFSAKTILREAVTTHKPTKEPIFISEQKGSYDWRESFQKPGGRKEEK